MIEVEVPGHGVIEFPDGTPAAEIERAIRQLTGPAFMSGDDDWDAGRVAKAPADTGPREPASVRKDTAKIATNQGYKTADEATKKYPNAPLNLAADIGKIGEKRAREGLIASGFSASIADELMRRAKAEHSGVLRKPPGDIIGRLKQSEKGQATKQRNKGASQEEIVFYLGYTPPEAPIQSVGSAQRIWPKAPVAILSYLAGELQAGRSPEELEAEFPALRFARGGR